METTYLSFAGLKIAVEHNYPQFQEKTEYVTAKCDTDFSVSITPEDIINEREICIKQCAYEGLVYPDYSPDELENTAIYRKIAQKITDYNAVVFHGSAVAVKNSAYLFTAPSGTGKTTHSNLWLENIEGSYIVNGDKPIIRIFEDTIKVCGTPWSGKENLGENICVPLKSICVLTRGKENHIEKISFSDAFSILIGQTYRSPDRIALLKTVKLLETIAKNVKLHRLECNMEKDAAFVSFGGMCGD